MTESTELPHVPPPAGRLGHHHRVLPRHPVVMLVVAGMVLATVLGLLAVLSV